MEIRHYTTPSKRDLFADWIASLRDRRAEARIVARLNRLAADHWGDWKFVGGGVFELRVDYGPGYRVYFAKIDNSFLLLLCGGDKRTQAADIRKAIGYLQDYKQRKTTP